MAITTNPRINKYTVESYKVGSGEHLETIVADTENRLEAFKKNHEAKRKDVTTFTTSKNFNPIASVRDREDDAQNDLFWSSYNVMD